MLIILLVHLLEEKNFFIKAGNNALKLFSLHFSSYFLLLVFDYFYVCCFFIEVLVHLFWASEKKTLEQRCQKNQFLNLLYICYYTGRVKSSTYVLIMITYGVKN